VVAVQQQVLTLLVFKLQGALAAHQHTPVLPCSVAFAVLAAAQTAAAVALRQSVSSSTLSEQDFYMCSSADKFQMRGCSTGWSLKEGMLAFAQLQSSGQLPVVEACRRYEPRSKAPCSRSCTPHCRSCCWGSSHSRCWAVSGRCSATSGSMAPLCAACSCSQTSGPSLKPTAVLCTRCQVRFATAPLGTAG
jgi:hypothetical protein